MKILSIICAYHPNNEALSSLARTLSTASNVVVVLNGGTFAPDQPLESTLIQIYEPGENLGTLAAYNRIIEMNPSYDYYWLWNQDTVISSESVAAFISRAQTQFLSDPALVGVTVFDRKNFINPLKRRCILAKESTTLFSASRMRSITDHWFDASLFMDYGDWEISYRIFQCGGRISQLDGIKTGHRLGDPEATLLGRFYRSSPMRLHMQGINSARLIRRLGPLNFITSLLAMRTALLPFKNMLFKDSWRRTRLYFKGLQIGLKGLTSEQFITQGLELPK